MSDTAYEIMPDPEDGQDGTIEQEPIEADPTHDHDEEALEDAADKQHVTDDKS